MSSDHPDEMEAAQAEIARLRAEVTHLRDLLGLDRRSGDGHRVAWSPTLFAGVSEPSTVDASSPLAQRVALMRSLFGARSDVFAVRWENRATGKSGWSPATARPTQRRSKEYLPLTDEALRRHLRGEMTVGIYPLLADDRCALLACDFDGGSWVLDALAYLDACHGAGVPAVLERSRSGDGGHVWVFFEQPVPAAKARAMGASLLRAAMSARAEIDLASYDRFFPSQDFMPNGSFGNLIALPLQGACAEVGTTVFLDPATLEPWADQWRLLATVARLSLDAVVALSSALPPVEVGPAHIPYRRESDPPAPEVVRARLVRGLSIERAGLPPSLIASLKHLGSIQNPVFYERQRMRFSTWDTPRFIRCYDEDLQWIHLPRGLIEAVGELLAQLGSRLESVDDRPHPPHCELEFHGTLGSQQADTVTTLIGYDRGVLVAPPGSGKTVVACAVMAYHQTPTLVVVDRKPLIDQWRQRITTHLGMEPSAIGQLGAGKRTLTGVVDIAMVQSLARRDDLDAIFGRYGLVVVDECHHIPAVTFEACVKQSTTRRWLGLTATPYRRDGLEGIITMQCGPIRHQIAPQAVEGAMLLQRNLVIHTTATTFEGDHPPIHDVFRAIAEDDTRTHQISADVDRALRAGRACLVLTQRIAHLEAICRQLTDLGHHPLVLRGGLGKRATTAVLDALAARKPGDGIALVATGPYLGEGFDWPDLDTLFLAFPVAFKGRVVQYVGRLLRPREGKLDVEIHDYVDTNIAVLDRMHTKRLPAYRILGFDPPRH